MRKSILADLQITGAYTISVERAETLAAEAATLDYPLIRIAPEKSASTKAWLHTFGKTLAFPDHFGANFDALYDCLCDRQIMPQDNCVLVLQHLEILGINDGKTLRAVARAACDEWRSEGRRLWVLFVTADLDLTPLPVK